MDSATIGSRQGADWEENQNNKFSAEHVKSMVNTSKNQEYFL